jgi:hypothetical protein
MEPRSDAGAVLKLRSVAKVARTMAAADDDHDRTLPAIARVTWRTAKAVERGNLTTAHIASLRALLRDGERIDDVLNGFTDTTRREAGTYGQLERRQCPAGLERHHAKHARLRITAALSSKHTP